MKTKNSPYTLITLIGLLIVVSHTNSHALDGYSSLSWRNNTTFQDPWRMEVTVEPYQKIKENIALKGNISYLNQASGLSINHLWLDNLHHNRYHMRVGKIRVPFGLENERYLPYENVINSPSTVAQYIIPITWTSLGIGYTTQHQLGPVGIHLETYLIDGLKDAISVEYGLQKAKQDHTDNNSYASMVMRLHTTSMAGYRAGFSFYTGPYSNDGTKQLSITGADIAYKLGPLEIITEWAQVGIQGSPSLMTGYYLENRYHFFPSFLEKTPLLQRLNNPIFILFSRYSAVNLNATAYSQDDDKTQLNIGVSLKDKQHLMLTVEQEWILNNQQQYYSFIVAISKGFTIEKRQL